jgi:hypothetical protein
MRTTILSIVLAAFVLLPVPTAEAQFDQAQFGPNVGYESSPDAFSIGANIIFYSLIQSMQELAFGADFHVGFGSQESGNVDFDYTTITFAVLAYYAFMLNPDAYLMPLAGLMYYKLKYGDCGGFGFSCDFSEVGLALGAGLLYQQFLVRFILGVGDVNDFSIRLAYMFGGGRPPVN